MFLPFKILFWCLALRYGDSGSPARPWIVSAILTVMFGVLDLFTDHFGWLEGLTLFGLYLVSLSIFLNLRYRLDGTFSTIVMAIVGTAAVFIGIPFLMTHWFDTGTE